MKITPTSLIARILCPVTIAALAACPSNAAVVTHAGVFEINSSFFNGVMTVGDQFEFLINYDDLTTDLNSSVNAGSFNNLVINGYFKKISGTGIWMSIGQTVALGGATSTTDSTRIIYNGGGAAPSFIPNHNNPSSIAIFEGLRFVANSANNDTGSGQTLALMAPNRNWPAYVTLPFTAYDGALTYSTSVTGTFTSIIPEPTSALSLLAGTALLCARRRRRSLHAA